MSSKLNIIIALCVLVTVFEDIPIVCQLSEKLNECTRMCITKFSTSRHLRSPCIHNCQLKYKKSSTNGKENDKENTKRNKVTKTQNEHAHITTPTDNQTTTTEEEDIILKHQGNYGEGVYVREEVDIFELAPAPVRTRGGQLRKDPQTRDQKSSNKHKPMDQDYFQPYESVQTKPINNSQKRPNEQGEKKPKKKLTPKRRGTHKPKSKPKPKPTEPTDDSSQNVNKENGPMPRHPKSHPNKNRSKNDAEESHPIPRHRKSHPKQDIPQNDNNEGRPMPRHPKSHPNKNQPKNNDEKSRPMSRHTKSHPKKDEIQNDEMITTTTLRPKPKKLKGRSLDDDQTQSSNELGNETNQKSSTNFNKLNQPDHCGYKSTKDYEKSKGQMLRNTNNLGRIVGGTDANPHEFPWITTLQYYTENNVDTAHFCGGAIITKNQVLTAAHCMDRFVGKERSLLIKVGVNGVYEKSEQTLTITKITVHHGWNASTQLDDIALIKFEPDVKFTTTKTGQYIVNALCLPQSRTEPTGDAVIAGWGEFYFKAGAPAEYLQKVNVPFVERSVCGKEYNAYLMETQPDSLVKVKHNHICAGGKGGEDACRGDSGGPLVQPTGRQYFQYGLVSFSAPCAIKDLPTIYTNIIHYMDWIISEVNS